MKRSGFQRKLPPSGTPGKPVHRKTGKHVGENKAKKLARHRSGGECEVRSPWHQGAAREFSHRLAEGQGGKWLVVNGLDSCGHGNLDGCHGYIHQHPEDATKYGWIVSAWGDPATTPVFIWHDGRQDWFLLREDGTAVLAEFPVGDPRHPDDIERLRSDPGLGGVA